MHNLYWWSLYKKNKKKTVIWLPLYDQTSQKLEVETTQQV